MSTAIASKPAAVKTAPEDPDALYEVINGQRVEVPPMGVYECFVGTRLSRFLEAFASDLKKGRVVAENLFVIDPAVDLQRRPDIAYVSFERWPASRRVPMENAWNVIPDLATEVVSRSNTADEIMGKLHEYFRAGVRVVWVVYPRHRLVYIYTSLTGIRVVAPDGVLDGAPVLPDFQLPLAELFQDGEETTASANGA